jgi:hypothetical protein
MTLALLKKRMATYTMSTAYWICGAELAQRALRSHIPGRGGAQLAYLLNV